MIKHPLNRRLSFTLFIAIVTHVIVLFTVGFSWATSHKSSTTIEVTLAHYQSEKKINEADFFAQIDQQGSGEGLDKKLLSQEKQFSPEKLTEKALPEKTDAQMEKSSEAENTVTDFDAIISLQSDLVSLKKQLTKHQTEHNDSAKTNSLSEQIAALNSEIESRKEKMARAPKKRTISTISTKSHQDAEYLEDWRQKIVSVGNQHYPKAANEQKIYGRVRLLIAMQAEGNIQSIEILESSGKKLLDLSAIKIIKLAAPFKPFSAQMRKNTDILEIIRTIEFEKSTLIY